MVVFKGAILALIAGLITSHLPAQNPKINGYMGIWYSTGDKTEYGFKLSGGFATFGSRHLPTAIYSPAVKKTFFVYGGTKSPEISHLLIMISYYDHLTHKVPKPVMVYDKEGVRNPYDNASMTIDNNGYIWVFVSGWMRTRPGLIFKSTQPYSIESFDQVLIKEMSFPQPWWSDSAGLMLTFSKIRNGLEINFSKSSDGINWSEDKTLVAMGGSGAVTTFKNGVLYVVFNYHPDGDIDKRTNLYMICTSDYGETWKTIDNKTVNIPLSTVDNEALIRDFRSEGKLVHIYDINFDGNGKPVILICTGGSPLPGHSNIPREWMVVKREDGEWKFYKICETDNNFDASVLIIDGKKWIVAGPSGAGPQKYAAGGEMEAWESNDEGRTWQFKKEITSESLYNHSYPKRPLNANSKFFLWWADGNAYEFSESRIYLTNDNFKRVYMLPYNMKKNFEKPVTIK